MIRNKETSIELRVGLMFGVWLTKYTVFSSSRTFIKTQKLSKFCFADTAAQAGAAPS